MSVSMSLKFLGGVTVIIPVHNGRSTLQAAVQSAERQSHRPSEIIVLDDGSTDGLTDADLLHCELPLRYVRLAKKSGASAARNLGVTLSKTRWVAFLDADDTWFKDKLERQLDAMARSGCGERALCSCNALVLKGPGREVLLNKVPTPTADFERLIWTQRFSLLTSGFLISRRLALEVRFDEARPNLQDLDFVVRSWNRGVSMIYLSAPLFRYSHAPNSGRISHQSAKAVSATDWYVQQTPSTPFYYIAVHFVAYCVDANFLRGIKSHVGLLKRLFGPEPRRLFWLIVAVHRKAMIYLSAVTRVSTHLLASDHKSRGPVQEQFFWSKRPGEQGRDRETS